MLSSLYSSKPLPTLPILSSTLFHPSFLPTPHCLFITHISFYLPFVYSNSLFLASLPPSLLPPSSLPLLLPPHLGVQPTLPKQRMTRAQIRTLWREAAREALQTPEAVRVRGRTQVSFWISREAPNLHTYICTHQWSMCKATLP